MKHVEWMGGPKGLEGADVEVAPGIVVELATLTEGGREWGVWGVRIDGKLYREPRDLTAEPLADGPFRRSIEELADREYPVVEQHPLNNAIEEEQAA